MLVIPKFSKRGRRYFGFFEKCNFSASAVCFEVLAARPYQSENVCKSWSELVKISVSYDQNKFSIVFINEKVKEVCIS